ncbi:hypothetical protein GOV13_04415 [Candidatus Pacearchaeota archaeon]|nr:hypothetical protein [Candidatus Pacearchaeota archaeon]
MKLNVSMVEVAAYTKPMNRWSNRIRLPIDIDYMLSSPPPFYQWLKEGERIVKGKLEKLSKD